MKLKIYSLLFACALSLSSCDDFYTLERETQNYPEWTSVSDINYMLNSSYKFLFGIGGFASNGQGCYNAYSECIADVGIMCNTSIQGWMTEMNARDNYPFSPNSNLPPVAFQPNAYKSISCTNTIIGFYKDVEAGNVMAMNNLSAENKAALAKTAGEAYFMRAFAYWYLSRVFMPMYSSECSGKKYMPLVTKRYYTDTEILNPPMATMQEVYDQMINDLLAAKACFKEAEVSNNTIKSTPSEANIYAASALLARIYFVAQKWNLSLAECDYVINNSPFAITTTDSPIRAFNRNLSSPAPVANEVIFEIGMPDNTAVAYNLPIMHYLSKVGFCNFKNVQLGDSATNPDWLDGGRGANWKHDFRAVMYWNPYILHQIGWIDDANYGDPTTEALSDKRFVQLHYALKPYSEKPAGMSDAAAKLEYEVTTQFQSLTTNIVWPDKYFRAPNTLGTQMPLIRLAEVYLTKASIERSLSNNDKAIAALNVIRSRAGIAEYPAGTTITEEMIEAERIKEMAFESGDRFTYLNALKKGIPSSNKTTAPGSSFLPAIAYPCSDLYFQLSDAEVFYSQSAIEAEVYQ